MSHQVGQLLPPETQEEALAHLARHPAVGGWKQLAAFINLTYADDPEEAGKWLRRALNPNRRENFTKNHFDRALKMGHRTGCHVLWDWHCRNCGYQPSGPMETKSRRLILAEEDERLSQRRRQIAEELDEIDRRDAVKDLRRAGDAD